MTASAAPPPPQPPNGPDLSPLGPSTAPWVQRAMPKPPLPTRQEVRLGALVAGVLALLGAPAGLVWAYAVPQVAVLKVGAPAYLLPAATEDVAAMGGDLVMIGILLALGVAAALAVLVWSPRAQLGPLVGLLVGGALCGLIAMAVGHLLVEGDYRAVFGHAEDGTVFQIRPYVRGSADFLVLPLIAGFVFLLGQLPALLRGRPTKTWVPQVSSGAAASGSDAAPGQSPAS